MPLEHIVALLLVPVSESPRLRVFRFFVGKVFGSCEKAFGLSLGASKLQSGPLTPDKVV